MRCDHPDCTGIHSNSRPYRDLCPRARERKRVANRRAVDRYQSTAKGFLTRVRANGHRRKGIV